MSYSGSFSLARQVENAHERRELGLVVLAHLLDGGPPLRMDRFTSLCRVVGNRFHGVDRRLCGLEFVPFLDDGARLLELPT